MSGLTDETAGKKNVPNKCRNEFSDIRAHGYFWICVVFVEAVIVVGFFVISEATVSFEILKYAYIQTDRQAGRPRQTHTPLKLPSQLSGFPSRFTSPPSTSVLLIAWPTLFFPHQLTYDH